MSSLVKIYKHIKDKRALKESQPGEDTRSQWRESQSGTTLTEKEVYGQKFRNLDSTVTDGGYDTSEDTGGV